MWYLADNKTGTLANKTGTFQILFVYDHYTKVINSVIKVIRVRKFEPLLRHRPGILTYQLY